MKKIINIGDKEVVIKQIREEDIILFANASGDMNPLHLDEKYAKKSIFGKRIAHGMLSAAYISQVLGTKLPGEGSIYLSQTLNFCRPVYLDDTLEIVVEVTNIIGEEITLKTICKNQKGKNVVEGEAKILLQGVNDNDI